jgi:hypothetical protein
MTTQQQINYIILYTGIKKEIITNYKKGMENMLEIYTENGLDVTTFFHKTTHQNQNKIYFICQKDKTHTIFFNDEPMEIPIDMNVSEFQLYINCYEDICPIECCTAYFLDETFTKNGKYTNDILKYVVNHKQ